MTPLARQFFRIADDYRCYVRLRVSIALRDDMRRYARVAVQDSFRRANARAACSTKPSAALAVRFSCDSARATLR